MWYHAHISWLRASVHGPIVLQPRDSQPHPFPSPRHEITIMLGEAPSSLPDTRTFVAHFYVELARRRLKHPSGIYYYNFFPKSELKRSHNAATCEDKMWCGIPLVHWIFVQSLVQLCYVQHSLSLEIWRPCLFDRNGAQLFPSFATKLNVIELFECDVLRVKHVQQDIREHHDNLVLDQVNGGTTMWRMLLQKLWLQVEGIISLMPLL